jgi:CDP-glycerol glycerophosphotransferase (TagB/SpsB family)
MAALNTGPDIHLLDHIAPLAALKKIPLLISEEENYALAAKYYPNVELRYTPEFNYQKLAAEFDTLYECKYWTPQIKETFRLLTRKNMELVFCPHGQSDKGYAAPLLAPYAIQDKILLYGPLMQKMLSELQIPLPKHEFIGNYRLQYYRKHQTHYQSLAHTEIFSHLNPQNKTLLYAPTWQDADQATTFFAYATKLVSELPPDWNLLIKINPSLESKDPALYQRLTMHLDKPNCLLLHKSPPIYPILEQIDAYLGDYSSVGYDVLPFQKPMFFLLQDRLPKGRLHQCGTILDPNQNLFRTIDAVNRHGEAQRELYQEAYISQSTFDFK